MDIEDAYSAVVNNLTIDVGKFYAPGDSLSLGKGIFYSGVLYPIYDEDQEIYITAQGLVYILTHECDVDPDNERLFNDDLLICPVIPFEHLIESLQVDLSEASLGGFLGNLATRRIYRLIYIPPCPQELPYGGVMYLNHITNTHVSAFERVGVKRLAALTGYGLGIVEPVIENHLLRPKAERLAYVPDIDQNFMA
jgi:hypothetical protein